MCTAMIDDRVRRRALELGAIEFIEKGHDPRVLVNQVRAAALREEVIA
jgi:DNA-binding response OmpR family regulator